MNELKKINDMCKKVQDYLNDNYDPHTKIVIEANRILMVNEVMGIPREKATLNK